MDSPYIDVITRAALGKCICPDGAVHAWCPVHGEVLPDVRTE